jgi:fructose-1,6-bisphosphatase/inositol monophosphatase family enzyme
MSLARDYKFVCETTASAADKLKEGFSNPALHTSTAKPDGSPQIGLDLYVHDHVEGVCEAAGYKLHSEEEKHRTFGRNNVLVLDPVDGSKNTLHAQLNNLQTTIAGVSLAYWRNGPIIGAAGFPLLGSPRVIYSAAQGMGAWREINGQKQRLRINPKPTRGIVLTTPKQDDRALKFNKQLEDLGFTPFMVDGAVFKGCAAADPSLLQRYKRKGFNVPRGEVVGFASWRPEFHDIAAVACIAAEAGCVVTKPKNEAGSQPWVAANNQEVHDQLFKLVTS